MINNIKDRTDLISLLIRRREIMDSNFKFHIVIRSNTTQFNNVMSNTYSFCRKNKRNKIVYDFIIKNTYRQ